MPTGYTYPLLEDGGQTFPQFALSCARAMGACVMMRDDPRDKPIPEFKPSDYYSKAAVAAQELWAKLKGMSVAEKTKYGAKLKSDAITQYEGYVAKQTAENKVFSDMEAKVHEWTPPTSEHNGLKTFMLEQLSISKSDMKYWYRMVEEARTKSPLAYFAEAWNKAERDIEYHTKGNVEEIQRTNGRNAWVKQLRASLKT